MKEVIVQTIRIRNKKDETVYDAGRISGGFRDCCKESLGGEAREQPNCNMEDDTSENPVEIICASEISDIIKKLKNVEGCWSRWNLR